MYGPSTVDEHYCHSSCSLAKTVYIFGGGTSDNIEQLEDGSINWELVVNVFIESKLIMRQFAAAIVIAPKTIIVFGGRGRNDGYLF